MALHKMAIFLNFNQGFDFRVSTIVHEDLPTAVTQHNSESLKNFLLSLQ